MSDERLLKQIAADEIAYWKTLGITVVDVEPSYVRLRLDMRPELGTRRPDVMHGGAVASLIDAAAGAATATTRREDDETWEGQATTDLNVTFVSAATAPVIAGARVLRGGRSIVFVAVEVRDEKDDSLIAVGRATYTILRR